MSRTRVHLLRLAAVAGAVVFLGGLLSPMSSVAASETPITSISAAPPSVPSGDSLVPGDPITADSGTRATSGSLSGGSNAAPKSLSGTSSGKQQAFDPSKATITHQDAFNTTYRNPDGTMTSQMSLYPMNVKTGDSWAPVNTKISTDAVSRGYKVDQNPLSPHFAGATGTGNDFTVSNNGYVVSAGLASERRVSASVPTQADLRESDQPGASADQGISYPSVMPGSDLTYQVSETGVKEALVLNQVPATSQKSWTWSINAPGLNLVSGPAGSVLLEDANGQTQFQIPTPVMTDSSGVDGKSANAEDTIPVTLTQGAGGNWLITLTPDRTWLTSASRAYPVTLDPSISSPTAGQIISYESSDGNDLLATEGYANIGNSQNDGVSVWRTVAYYRYESPLRARNTRCHSWPGLRG